jgi:dolichyl-phosphate beta-glucosyltransferase
MAQWKMINKISLILPAYNEAARIEGTVNSAVKHFENLGLDYEIIVSADGDDGTRELVSRMSLANSRLMAIGGVERRGKGYGIRQAVAIANGEVIGFVDADDKTPFTEFDKFLPYLQDGWEVVIGSRGQPKSVIERPQPWYRRIGSKGFGVFMHVVTGLWDIADTQCGFKFFKGEIAKDLFARQKIDGYMYDVEILYLARRAGYHIQQVPVRWRDDGDSRLDLIAGNIRNVQDIFKIRFNNYD